MDLLGLGESDIGPCGHGSPPKGIFYEVLTMFHIFGHEVDYVGDVEPPMAKVS